ncbi:SURF1 family cytochrome oxidase biogenesis protein [Novosphingobium mangrovi (ex Huang et al. 2023)]|uniref:SURF1-like protein n=1 Tax=Novosphingobium mangrovi (ex Huang et al. 2023) TaxID=2976432 RepID=A0ABT2I0F4_9SPHN|nr:SURF1 family cytochrome oxidase biogenesis protein [Novosphingobium mangrovi (ex Huang et al. 2023)]MCT2398285.1 SURF1 family protein [Novosphingobium mangrovi (ex Huang et al. 2023)]
MRRIPVFPTLVVLVAAGIMISLGFWQLRRLHEKEALLAHYAAARDMSEEIDWTSGGVGEDVLYHRAHMICAGVKSRSSMAGKNADGESGLAQTAQCVLPGGGEALVVLGWSLEPNAGLEWQGGTVRGIIAPGPRLVADPPVAGLQANAEPDPADIPNNHLSYAIQWFLFAATALVIYAIALRKRLKQG